MNLTLVPLKTENIEMFKRDMQEAFQYGYETECGPSEELILPEKDIDASLNTKGAEAYQVIVNVEIVGGAVINIDKETYHNHLDFLFVKGGC
jgi:hypothetical protein